MTRVNFTEYLLRDGDTLLRLAEKFYGNAALWAEIARFNKLSYPYIAKNNNSLKANGFITFFRDPAETGDILIPAGTIVSTDPEKYSPNRYQTLKDVTMASAKDTVEIEVESFDQGILGNSPDFIVKYLETPIVGISSILNKEKLSIFVEKERATGTVTFSRREGFTGTYVIPYGTLVSTTYNIETRTNIRYYFTTEEVTLVTGDTTVDAPIICTEAGVIGNVSGNTINVVVDLIKDSGTTVVDAVVNTEELSTGEDRNILYYGQYIYIPRKQASSREIETFKDKDKEYLLYGEDIRLRDDGDFIVSETGDLESVWGIDNAIQSIKSDLDTPIGSLYFHKEFGNKIPDLIGSTGDRRTLTIVKQEMIRVLESNIHVSSVSDLKVGFVNGTAVVVAEVNLKGSSEVTKINLGLQGG